VDLAGDALRVTELIGSLSLAADLGTGQPLGHGLSTGLLAVTLAAGTGCDPERLRAVQQVAMLRFIGCTSDAGDLAREAGTDDVAFSAAFAPVFSGRPREGLQVMFANVGSGQSLARRTTLLARLLTDTGGMARSMASHCEVASMLAVRLGLGTDVSNALAHAYERWDGKGYPDGLEGEEIPFEVRVAVVARDADLFARLGEDVAAKLEARRGRAYDPAVVDTYLSLRPPHEEADWQAVLDTEPHPVAYVDDIDRALTAIAHFADLKSTWTRGHSPRVAELAHQAGHIAGEDGETCGRLRRAGLVHDVGRVGIGNHIWDKPGPLATAEWEQVRLHPYHTERVLSRCAALAHLGALACSHHERLDGSGYPRQTAALTAETNILAAADMLAALTADRPHRPGLTLEDAVAVLTADAEHGRLDRRAVSHVIEAAGLPPTHSGTENPAGLTDREVEVLRLLAGGSTNRQVGDSLFISPKTVGRHVENIYSKIGVSTRAGAAVFAMEHRLLG
jgi:HD-GYP domain-containing protein (c-di-GMP phosphodiesterase class II)